MILGLASPTYSGILPDHAPLLWLLDRCAEYDLKALEAPLPLSGADHPKEVKEKAADLGVTWVGYWSEDFVTPDGGGIRLREQAERAFDQASIGGVKTVVIFGRGSLHNRFTGQPPLADQLRLAADHLRPVAEAASERDIQLALLPHLDYRSHEMVSVMEKVCHPNLIMAFDTANPFPVCEEPVAAAKVVLPHAVAVAFKDVQIYPGRSNDVTIWGTPIGRGSVDFETLLPMLSEQLPDPEKTTACIKLRLPPGSAEHADWMDQSLTFLRSHL
ncbi:MAG: TIM barrel protein [Gemmatimonadetes bacterium]|nr:TIM barrel protein [Gemmatimonadota bacterium]MYF17854.1 TIM barrel protein [Gemmatimonadota bacterium]